jgi:replicative DNA helicase
MYSHPYSKSLVGHDPIRMSGWAPWDALTGGFLPGEVVVIGGRPGMGKTQVLLHLAKRLKGSGNTYFFPFDTPYTECGGRLGAMEAGVSLGQVKTRRLSEEEWKRFESSYSALRYLKILFMTKERPSLSQISDALENMDIEEGGMLIIDDAQHLRSAGSHQHRDAELTLLMRQVRHMTRKHQLITIISSQLSRGPETRGGDCRPKLSDLRDSGALEQYADKVFMLYRPDQYHIMMDEDGQSLEHVLEVELLKNLSGLGGNFRLYHDGYMNRIEDKPIDKHFTII